MHARIRRCALALGLALVAACDGDHAFAPRDVAGVWVSAWPQTTQVVNIPDTLALNSRGDGRIKSRTWLEPLTPGGPYREVWMSSPVRWEIRADSVLFDWCMQVPEQPPHACPEGQWDMSGHLRSDAMLWIGPTSMVSSMSALPWRRVGGLIAPTM